MFRFAKRKINCEVIKMWLNSSIIFLFFFLLPLAGSSEGLTVDDCEKMIKDNIQPPHCAPNYDTGLAWGGSATLGCGDAQCNGVSYNPGQQQACIDNYMQMGYVIVGEIMCCITQENEICWPGDQPGRTVCQHPIYLGPECTFWSWFCQTYEVTFDCETLSIEKVPIGDPVDKGCTKPCSATETCIADPSSNYRMICTCSTEDLDDLLNQACACEDNDGDGHYAINSTCSQGDDCNDNDPTINPGAAEICEGTDNDCNGQIDDNCTAEEMPDDDLGCPEGEVCTCPE